MKGMPVEIYCIIGDFQRLAKYCPNFTVRDAEAAGAWSCYKGRATGLKFNEVKHLAGLPYKMRAANGQGGQTNKYEPCKLKTKGGKRKRCLGILPNDEHCTKIVASPARLCHKCRERNNNS